MAPAVTYIVACPICKEEFTIALTLYARWRDNYFATHLDGEESVWTHMWAHQMEMAEIDDVEDL